MSQSHLSQSHLSQGHIPQSQLSLTGAPPLLPPSGNLASFNMELVKCLEDLRERREEVNRLILAEEEEKARIQKEISLLTDRLGKLNESLVRKAQARAEYDRTIGESEMAYVKIMESSQTLLHVLKKERDTLAKKKTHA